MLIELDIKDLKEICTIVSNDTNIPSYIIEKDFWVISILDWIFNKSIFKNHFVFKGGTSLSKAYKLINRFSEDIDLGIDFALLDIKKSEIEVVNNPNKAKKLFKKFEINGKAFLINNFIPLLKAHLEHITKQNVKLEIDCSRGILKIKYFYLNIFDPLYLLSYVLIEINPIGYDTQNEQTFISSIICQKYPQIFKTKQIKVISTSWMKTFWDKINILHNKSHSSHLESRYSRHYLDVYNILKSKPQIDALLQNIQLLFNATNFKIKYYYSKNAKYEDILVGKVSLIPNEEMNTLLEKDYLLMKDMIYGKPPAWYKIIEKLKWFEGVLNQAIIEFNKSV